MLAPMSRTSFGLLAVLAVLAAVLTSQACSTETPPPPDGGGGRDGGGGGDTASDRVVDAGPDAYAAHPLMTFFLTSTGSGAMGGNLGGLEGADAKCRQLATVVGAGGKTWVAWLSIENGPGGAPVHARDRVGPGPWHDSKGRLVAMNLAGLLPGPDRRPDGETAAVDDLLDETGGVVPKSPTEHDILTGTLASGLVSPGQTCGDWKSTDGTAQVGHADNRGPTSWTEAHFTMGCTSAGVAANGGNGRFYCLARP
jgi:hypothetical protein